MTNGNGLLSTLGLLRNVDRNRRRLMAVRLQFAPRTCDPDQTRPNTLCRQYQIRSLYCRAPFPAAHGFRSIARRHCWLLLLLLRERENAAVSVASLMHGAGRTPLALRTQYNWLRSAPITDAAVVADVSRLGSFLPSKSSVNRACLDPSLRSVLFGFYAPHSVVDVVGLRVSFLSDVGWMWMS